MFTVASLAPRIGLTFVFNRCLLNSPFYCFVPSLFLKWYAMHLCGGPGRRCRQPVTNPGETKRKPEFVTGVQGHLGGQWEHGPPSEVSMCEKARVQATRCCSTERRRCQALGVQVQPVGGFPRPVFLLFTKRMFNFLQRNLLPPAGLGGIGGQEPSSELSRLFPK